MWHGLLARLSRLGFTWARKRLDEDARREVQDHLDLLTERYIDSGMAPGEAQAAARRQFGNATLVREEIHRLNSIGPFEAIGHDLRYAYRQVRRAPGFAAIAIGTLGLGIGGTTAVFSVVQAVLLAPLPYEEAGRLVRFYQQEPGDPSDLSYLTGPHFRDIRDHAVSFEQVAALYTYSDTALDLVHGGRGRRLRVLPVTSDYFATLRAEPVRGTAFDPDDERGAKRIVLSDALWRTQFGSDPTIVGTAIRLSGESYEVTGIAPRGLADPIAGDVDGWVPHNLARETSEQEHSLTAVGRLRRGVDIEQAHAELAALSQAMTVRWPAAGASRVVAAPLKEDLVGASRGPLHLLLIAVGLVLVVACVNVANLVLVRATGRLHEFAVRAALGSGRGRLVRQLLVESLLLALFGGALGLLLAVAGVDILKGLGRDAIPRLGEVRFDPTVLSFAAAVTLATAIGFGMAPALRSSRVRPHRAMTPSRITGGRAHGGIRSGLATAQLALALTLLAGAGVLTLSFYRLQQVDLGFRTEGVLTFGVTLPSIRYDAERRALFQEELARQIARLPGVVAAGGTSRLPATGSYHTWGTRVDTGPLAGTWLVGSRGFDIQQRTISGKYFAALAIPVLAGRVFDDRDHAGVPSRAVVSAGFARRAFPGMPFDAVIGQRIAPVGSPREIVGVVGDVTADAYGAQSLLVYHAHRQFASNRNWSLAQVVASTLPAEPVRAAVQGVVAWLDPELVVYGASPLGDVVGRGISRERFALVLMVAFAVVSLMLAVLGLYGTLAYTVRQRTTEIGIRMALGATAGHVRALVLRQAAVALALGLVIGSAGALVLGRWLSSLLFQTSPWDGRILLTTAVLLTVAGLAAAWFPARRASRVEPRVAMQEG